MLKYFKFFDYYLEIFAKNLSGRCLTFPDKNGEFAILESIVKNNNKSICFMDGGSYFGEYIVKFDSSCKKYNIKNYSIYAIEPFSENIRNLRQNTKDISYQLIDKVLGKKVTISKFYTCNNLCASGQNSTIKHYYLNKSINIKQTTIDAIVKTYALKKINFLKLDIEGSEYNALLGAKNTLSNGLIDYIQLEYNQTWIEGGGTIKKILDLANLYSYKLFRIRKKDLLSIPKYYFGLDDFVFCNLLLVKDGCKLPLPLKRPVTPII